MFTGTVRANRLNRIPIRDKREIMKKTVERGFTDILYKEDMVLAAWKDNKAVYVASNRHPATTDATCRRFDRMNRKFIDVPQPFLIGQYNKGMGGVDLVDQMTACYRVSFHQKKWWFPFYR
jgi:hypothetical protein